MNLFVFTHGRFSIQSVLKQYIYDIFFCSHITTTASWLPPSENWGRNIEFPYGWEKAVDSKGRPYYIK